MYYFLIKKLHNKEMTSQILQELDRIKKIITPGSTWIHQKSGRFYTVKTIGMTVGKLGDAIPVIIYDGPDGLTWVRLYKEWVNDDYGNARFVQANCQKGRE